MNKAAVTWDLILSLESYQVKVDGVRIGVIRLGLIEAALLFAVPSLLHFFQGVIEVIRSFDTIDPRTKKETCVSDLRQAPLLQSELVPGIKNMRRTATHRNLEPHNPQLGRHDRLRKGLRNDGCVGFVAPVSLQAQMRKAPCLIRAHWLNHLAQQARAPFPVISSSTTACMITSAAGTNPRECNACKTMQCRLSSSSSSSSSLPSMNEFSHIRGRPYSKQQCQPSYHPNHGRTGAHSRSAL